MECRRLQLSWSTSRLVLAGGRGTCPGHWILGSLPLELIQTSLGGTHLTPHLTRPSLFCKMLANVIFVTKIKTRTTIIGLRFQKTWNRIIVTQKTKRNKTKISTTETNKDENYFSKIRKILAINSDVEFCAHWGLLTVAWQFQCPAVRHRTCATRHPVFILHLCTDFMSSPCFCSTCYQINATTLCPPPQKKRPPFYFSNNSVKN